MTFEKGLKRLESLVTRLERGEMGLDASLVIFEEGVGLVRMLTAKMDEAERKVEILIAGDDGELRTAPLEDDGDTELPGETPEED